MARRNHFYVLVLTNGGPVFVTELLPHHMTKWDCLKAPKEFTRSFAEEIATGLRLNGTTAYQVTLPYELDTQPYLYNVGKFEWVWSEEAKESGRYANPEEQNVG